MVPQTGLEPATSKIDLHSPLAELLRLSHGKAGIINKHCFILELNRYFY